MVQDAVNVIKIGSVIVHLAGGQWLREIVAGSSAANTVND